MIRVFGVFGGFGCVFLLLTKRRGLVMEVLREGERKDEREVGLVVGRTWLRRVCLGFVSMKLMCCLVVDSIKSVGGEKVE